MPSTQPSTSQERSHHVSRRARRVILGAFAIVLLLIVGGALYLRPVARANRLLTGVGLSPVPASAENLLVHRRRRFLATDVTYVRFGASVDGVAQFLAASALPMVDDSASMGTLSFGPRCPEWMEWETTAQGRMYHWTLERTSVWLAVDDETHIVYIGVFESQAPWLQRLRN